MIGMLRLIATLLVVVVAALEGQRLNAQYYYSPEFYLGGHGGMTMSTMAFAPKVKQSMISGALVDRKSVV